MVCTWLIRGAHGRLVVNEILTKGRIDGPLNEGQELFEAGVTGLADPKIGGD